MADTMSMYGLFWKSLGNKEIDIDSDTWKLMATTSSYTPNQDTHQYKSSVTNEVSGTNYTAGGLTIPSFAMTYDTGTNKLVIDAADANWAGPIPLCRQLVLYDSSPASDATRPLALYITLDADKQPSGIVWNASVIFSVTVP
jgi:hypothetical protein